MRGKVYLVGAGPGDPDLLTVKALRVLRSADVVLHDALVPAEILALLPRTTKVVKAGKRCGKKAITQEQINALMLEFAAQGFTVARLKSGDPLIFGRAGEELEALRGAGIETEVVPGITAGSAAAAALEIPLTDRRTASRLVSVTAHSAAGKPDPDWSALLSSETTAIIYMPGDDYRRIAKRLREAGVPAERRCAIVANVSRPEQQAYVTTVGELTFAPLLSSPVVIIVGELTAHSSCDLFAIATEITRNAVPLKFEELWSPLQSIYRRGAPRSPGTDTEIFKVLSPGLGLG